MADHILDDLYDYVGRFIAYPSEQARVAHVLWIAHAHVIDAFDTTPRLAVLSQEPASGKSRLLEISESLVPRPIEAVNMSPAALFRLVANDDGSLPTILFDEIDTVFGPKAKEHEDVRGLLNAGHRRGAKTYRCFMNGKKVEVEAIEAFCPVALAGLGWLPDTIMSRAVTIRMKRRAPNERVEPYRRRDFADTANLLRDRLEQWATTVVEVLRDARPDFPPGVEDRSEDNWEPLLAVADAAGDDWPARARAAALVLLKEASSEQLPSFGIQLLTDLRSVWGEETGRSTDSLLADLRALAESPWADIKGKPIDARRLANILRQYGVKSRNVRTGSSVVKGYHRDDLHDAWTRNLSPLPGKSATSATSATTQHSSGFEGVAAKPDVADQALHVAASLREKPASNGYVAKVADVAPYSAEDFEERAAILEHDGGLSREEAEATARRELSLDIPGFLDRRAAG